MPLSSLPQTVVKAASIIVVTVGLLVLFGWQFDIYILKSGFSSTGATMKVNTALGFILAGISLWLLSGKSTPKRHWTAKTAAVIVSLLGLITITQYVFGQNLGVDNFLLRDISPPTPASPDPGRMGINTAISFILLGEALLLVNKQQRRYFVGAEILTGIAALISLQVLIGYFYGIDIFYRWAKFTNQMALHTAIALIVLCVGILCLRPERGFIRLLTSQRLGGAIARRFLPGAIVIPLVVGWLIIQGLRLSYYDPAFALSLFAIVIIVLAVYFIRRNAQILERIDTEHSQLLETELARQQQITTIFESITDGFIALDSDWRYTYVNSQAEQILHKSRDDLLGKVVWEVFPNLVGSQFERQAYHAVREQVSVGFEYFSPAINTWLNMRIYPYQQGISFYFKDVSERRRNEAALQASEEKLRSFVESNVVGILFGDVDGNILQANDELLRMIGYTREELEAGEVRWIDLTPPEWLALDAERIVEAQQRGACTPYEKEYFRKDGSRIPILVGYVLTGEQRRESVAFILDLTQRKHIEAALQQSEQLYRTLSEAMPQLVWTCLSDGKADFLNQRWYEYTGLTYEQSQGLGWANIIHPQDQPRVMDEWQECLITGKFYEIELRYRRADGVYRWHLARAFPIQDSAGRITKWVGSSTDIDDYKQSEARIRSYTTRLEAMTEASRAFSVASLDFQTVLDTVSQQIAEVIGDSCSISLLSDDGELLTPMAVYHPHPENCAMVAERTAFGIARSLAAQGTHSIHEGLSAPVIQTGQPRLITANSVEEMSAFIPQVYRPYVEHFGTGSIFIVPLRVQNRVIGTLTVCRDGMGRCYTPEDQAFLQNLADRAAVAIDNAKLYQQAQEANRLKDEFLAVVSHELRSPLNPILGWSKLLRERSLDAATTAKALETIERNAQAQAQLIEDLLDISRMIRGVLNLNITPVNLVTAIEAAIDTVLLAAKAKNIEIEYVITPPTPPTCLVSGDANRLQQIFWNLLTNAVKFTPPGGKVQVCLSLANMAQFAQITVTDTGMGISSEFLPYIFERFRQADSSITRQHGGLGLGLAIVRNLVELHGGTIKADSPGKNQGATFTVSLPLIHTENQPYKPQFSPLLSHSLSEPLQGLHVLVVDDEPDTCNLLTTALQANGATVTAVSSAQTALAALTEVHPDILISDIGMPQEDGYALIRQVRSLPDTDGGKIPAVALTAYAREEDQNQALNAGFQMHLSKPVDLNKLTQAIAQLTTH